ncbi:hypothetical protein JTB14_038059 [Gonioctena quinquepunctata]|nr:hypothetical protein JTB14_038059 [Gonioctena quinquepunctata]
MQFEKVLCIIIIRFHCGYGQEYGYDGNKGPAFWGEKFQNCSDGKLQSPIDIEENNVTVVAFPPLIFKNFDHNLERVRLLNNGHTVKLSIEEGNVPVAHGGPLNGFYNFAQLHFHWGKTDTEGSENLINNHSFPLELHMVFFNTQYGSFDAAGNEPDGLAVLSFLYHKSDEDNLNYATFEDKLLAIKKIASDVQMVDFGSLDNFTTTDRNTYFTYKGSLTTPPCSEVVTWIEFVNTIPLSHSQIQEFRHLYGPDGKLEHNFRPTQPLFDRVVYMNSPGKSSTSRSELCYNTVFVLIVLKIVELF